MTLFKCKMCGGDLLVEEGKSVCECRYCGTKQTLPRLDDERRANLYDRANHFRLNNDFDKAMGIYETILNEDKTDAEAYWSLVLCKYGIEYVEDPATHRRVPTINRTQLSSVLADEDYKSALKYATADQKIIYENEAKTIDGIQKGILDISGKEEPFDVFICYKETDNYGRRTRDSVLAAELYHELTEEGFKVFFSRITLEDKLGIEYEPYIFAALNSAKVMVVLGTKPEYFKAAWVKNEWSRYLALIKNGAKKVLIPAYRDMDPYDLPEEFSHLQAQDMSKLGFMQDLIHGIRKLATAGKSKTTVKKAGIPDVPAPQVSAMIKRITLFMESAEWDRASEYCEKVLDNDPENGEAYLLKEMAEKRCPDLKSLGQFYYDKGLTSYNKNLEFAKRFGGNEMAEKLKNFDNILKLSSINLLKLKEEEKNRIKEERKRIDAELAEAKTRAAEIREHNEAADERKRQQEKRVRNTTFFDEYETNKKKENHELRDGCIGCFAVILIIFLLAWGCVEIFEPSEKEKAAKEAERIESARKYAEEQKKDEERRKAEELRRQEEERLRLEKLEQEEEARIAAAKKSTGLQWSRKSKESMYWKEAVEYCRNLEENGIKKWRLPNIDELRKLIRNCPRTKTGGRCKISKKSGCLSLKCYNSEGCACENKGYNSDYSILNDNYSEFWSSSVRSDDSYEVWYINFQDGGIYHQNIDTWAFVRCVK